MLCMPHHQHAYFANAALFSAELQRYWEFHKWNRSNYGGKLHPGVFQADPNYSMQTGRNVKVRTVRQPIV